MESNMFWMIIASLLFVACYLYYVYHLHWIRKGVKQRIVCPILGTTFDTFIRKRGFHEAISDHYNSFKNTRYIGFYQMLDPILMLRDDKLIKQICVKDFEHFLDHRQFLTENTDPLWTKNLFALRGQKWKEMRSILSPSFTGSKIRLMFTLMHECAKEFVQFFNNESAELLELDLKDTFTRYTNDIIATTAFGIQCDSLRNRNNDFYMRGRQISNIPSLWKIIKFILNSIWSGFGKIFKVTFFDEEFSNFFRTTIRETIDHRIKNNIERPDMIHLLMQARKETHQESEEPKSTEEANYAAVSEYPVPKTSQREKQNLSLDDITSQALIFFFAGFESVATAMCFLAYELALNPDVQRKLIYELDQCRKTNEKVTYEALSKLPYLDMVISETLRKWSPTVATDRYCTKPYTIEPEYPDEKELQLLPGDVISIPIWAIHHDPKYWPNPDKFDPERFSSENRDKIRPYTYLPFGVGPRNCIGSRFALIEIKALFFDLLAYFEIVPIEKTCIPFVPDRTRFFLAPANGFQLGFKKRLSSDV